MTTKKQIHELEESVREQLDPIALLYPVGTKDATRKAYALIFGRLESYKSNAELYDTMMIYLANQTEAQTRATDSAAALLDAYADAIGERPVLGDPEYTAAYRVAYADVLGAEADDYYYQRVGQMTRAIADRAHVQSVPTYPTIDEARSHSKRGDVVAVVTHEQARAAYEAGEAAAETIPAWQVRIRHTARHDAIADTIYSETTRYAAIEDVAAHIADNLVEYLHRHTVNLGTRRWSDYRPVWETCGESIVHHTTASKTGLSIDGVSTVFCVLVIG